VRYDYEITIDGEVFGTDFIGPIGAAKKARAVALENPEATIQMFEVVTDDEGDVERELLFSARGGGAAGGGHEAIKGDF